MSKYKVITIQDLINFVKDNKDIFPKGLDTNIMTADFEGNYLHEKHEIYNDYDKNKYKSFIVLCYEMHENYDDYKPIDEDKEE